MLENFKEIYDDELENDDNFFRRRILNESDIRMFVYEICKRIVASQQVSDKSCPECGSIEVATEKHCAQCWAVL